MWDKGQGSEWDQGHGSECDRGRGSEYDQGQGLECDQGQGSEWDWGQGSEYDRDQGSEWEQGRVRSAPGVRARNVPGVRGHTGSSYRAQCCIGSVVSESTSVGSVWFMAMEFNMLPVGLSEEVPGPGAQLDKADLARVHQFQPPVLRPLWTTTGCVPPPCVWP